MGKTQSSESFKLFFPALLNLRLHGEGDRWGGNELALHQKNKTKKSAKMNAESASVPYVKVLCNMLWPIILKVYCYCLGCICLNL